MILRQLRNNRYKKIENETPLRLDCRNAQNGATIKIAAKKLPKFSAGKAFKDAVAR
jgi:nucleoid DNA-binding protein